MIKKSLFRAGSYKTRTRALSPIRIFLRSKRKACGAKLSDDIIMSELPDYVLELLSVIAIGENLLDYTIELSEGSKLGDGFLGIIYRTILRGRRNKEPAELHLIIKLSSTNETRRKEFQLDAVYKREVHIYTQVLPLFAKFQRDRGLTEDEAFVAFPKCYAAVADVRKEQFVLIMEDMKEKGFAMLPKQEPIANEHLFMVVGQLARLHAISLAIKDQQPEAYKELRKVTDLFHCFFETEGARGILKSTFDRAIAVLDNERHIEWLTEVKNNVPELLDQVLGDNAPEPFGVIGHGDLWINNLMYRYDDNKVFIHPST